VRLAHDSFGYTSKYKVFKALSPVGSHDNQVCAKLRLSVSDRIPWFADFDHDLPLHPWRHRSQHLLDLLPRELNLRFIHFPGGETLSRPKIDQRIELYHVQYVHRACAIQGEGRCFI